MTPIVLLRAQTKDAPSVAPLRRVHAPAAFEYRVTHKPIGGVAKRVFDLLAASAALVVLSPLLLFVTVLIQLDSPGPAIYRQRRTGFRGRAFTILKFRTMHVMELGPTIVQARPGDARVTRVGRILRRTSIDELPQLINVLLGHMSLVGPRPHAIRHDRHFFLVDEEYPRRFRARPGITGAAQINGARGVTETPEDVERRLQLDLDYLRNWSFLRDLSILLQTVRFLLGDKHAC